MSLLATALLAATLAQGGGSDSIPLFDDLGSHHLAVSTKNTLAQRYFDQGLRLVYAFNHPDAIRSFRQAQRLDPSCAMCFWGEALAYGPNINVPMDSASGVKALDAIRRAQALAPSAGARDQAFIAALGARYAAGPGSARPRLDSAYARAMTSLSRRYPKDDDAATLRAEAYMLLKPWDYWTAGRKAKAHGAVAVAALEPVIARNPRHAGACHFFIHAVEAAYPERAVRCAERLPALMPGAGHVVHMPAHIYIRVGRYADAIDRNVHALHADAGHIGDMAPDGVYRLALHPHNGHFLSFAAAMIGRSAQAMEAANLTRAKTDTTMLRAPGFGALQHYYMLPLFTMVRFGEWDRVLAQPEPAEDLIYPRALRHYARARAFTARSDLAAAELEVAALRALRADPRLASVTIWDLNPVTALLDIGLDIAIGDVFSDRGDHVSAIARLRAAVEKEDALTYDEPPPWHIPARQELGAILLRAGRAAAAESVYRRDLQRHPGNGWSLHGLAASLDAQGRRVAAAEARRRFDRAWSTADVEMRALRGPEPPEPTVVPTPAAADFARRIAGCYRLDDGPWRADSVIAGDISTKHTPLWLELTAQPLGGQESPQSSERPMFAVRDSTDVVSYWQRVDTTTEAIRISSVAPLGGIRLALRPDGRDLRGSVTAFTDAPMRGRPAGVTREVFARRTACRPR